MPVINKSHLFCDSCNEQFDAEVPMTVFSTDTELKEKIINQTIYDFICPYCGKKKKVIYPVNYINEERNYQIFPATPQELILYKANRSLIPVKTGNHVLYGASSTTNLADLILILDKGYDPLIIYHICSVIMQLSILTYEIEKITDSFLSEDEKGRLVLNYHYQMEDKEGICSETITDKFYDDLAKAKKKFEGLDEFIMNYAYERKLFGFSDDELEKAKSYLYEFALVEISSGENALCFIQYMNEGKFRKDDFVTISHFDEEKGNYVLRAGYIIETFRMSDYDFPYEINDLPVVAYLNGENELSETGEMKKQYTPGGRRDYDVLIDSDVCLSFDAEGLPATDKNYCLLVYTDSSMLKEDMPFITTFKNVLNNIFNTTGQYDGITVCTPSGRFSIPAENLPDMVFNYVMGEKDRMSEIMFSLNEAEAEYLGKESFDTICKIYLEGKTPSELGLTKKQMDKQLGEGYSRVKNILLSRLSVLFQGKEYDPES